MKKYILSLSAILLFTFTAFAQKGEEVELIVNGIKNGTSYADLIGKIGKPIRQGKKQYDECYGGFGKTVWYNGLEIKLFSDEDDDNYKVSSMKITSAKWITAERIKIGSSLSVVKSKYGKAFESTENGLKVLTYEMKNGPGGVIFYFRGTNLVKFELIPTIC
ncbi:MAG: hypothetical protein MUC29_06280 [Pyrinomonadaceae bacterium]|nr:hypothetical protein [Pyrinomonadaceae bacterium]